MRRINLRQYHQRVVFDHVVSQEDATQRERFEAVARTLRDLLAERWLETDRVYERKNPKQVYYLSMEFLLGRMLVNNVINLGMERQVARALGAEDPESWTHLIEAEPDAGLGNGGLGRLAACFIDSMATLRIPATGYGLRYEYGVFRQEIRDGYQIEHPDPWLQRGDPWEVERPRDSVVVPLGCSFELVGGNLEAVPGTASHLVGIPHDRPVVGYGGQTINTLRLWGAASPDYFHFSEFNSGDFVGAIVSRVVAETVTRVLYPDDSTLAGQALRFLQEYFLVCCSIGDIVRRFRQANDDWSRLPDQVAIQLNDTHPALAVPELMRVLLDEGGLDWDTAWRATQRTLAYTNHTLLPEALERWPVRFFELICPRLLEIIYEINHRFLQDVRRRFPHDDERLREVSLIEESPVRQVRMAHLAVVGTHRTNGVAKIHSELLRSQVLPSLARLFPQRFGNHTNGVSPRRWLLQANPDLSDLITDAVGDGWVTDLSRLSETRTLAEDASFRDQLYEAKRQAKRRFANWLRQTTGMHVDPETLFDSQVKRIHEYKRQLLNLLHVVRLYQRLRENPNLDVVPRTFFFAGKAAPSYRLAKLIIKAIHNVAEVVNADPCVAGRIKIVFLANYNVSLAERLVAASDVSEQISTAGFEASGTGNMKFMMNGALTIGTRDGATIEMAEAAGEENLFLFGLTAEQVAASRHWYSPRWHYDHEPEVRETLDLLFNGHFSRGEPGVLTPLREVLLDNGDHFRHLADFGSYVEAQRRLDAAYRDRDDWFRRAAINIAASGWFSSDRTVHEYASATWKARPCPVDGRGAFGRNDRANRRGSPGGERTASVIDR